MPTTSWNHVDGRTVIIVGATSGMGRSTAHLFAARGASVVVAGIVDTDGLKVEAEIQAKGGKAKFIHVDVANETSVNALLKASVAEFGRIDYAVNCAGITGPQKEAHTLTLDEWRQVFSVDLEGNFLFCKVMIEYFRQQEPRLLRDDPGQYFDPVKQKGSIVMVASTCGSLGVEWISAYCSAKHGILGLMKTAALENASYGIRVNAVSPGVTLTPMVSGADSVAREAFLRDQPMARFAHPDEIAHGIYFLTSDAASYITGTDFGVDGGYLTH